MKRAMFEYLFGLIAGGLAALLVVAMARAIGY